MKSEKTITFEKYNEVNLVELKDIQLNYKYRNLEKWVEVFGYIPGGQIPDGVWSNIQIKTNVYRFCFNNDDWKRYKAETNRLNGYFLVNIKGFFASEQPGRLDFIVLDFEIVRK